MDKNYKWLIYGLIELLLTICGIYIWYLAPLPLEIFPIGTTNKIAGIVYLFGWAIIPILSIMIFGNNGLNSFIKFYEERDD